MVGKPERSGGRREGAGRPPRMFRLRLGETVALTDGGLLETGRVTKVTRSKVEIQLKDRKLEIIR